METAQTWEQLRALDRPNGIPRYMSSPTAAATFAAELARVAAHEGEPARENFRWRAWLNPRLAPVLPAETRQVAA